MAKLYKRGSTGAQVTVIQTRLIELGFMKPNTSDGRYGPMTEQAVSAFQKSKGLVVDGTVGPITRSAMFDKQVPERKLNDSDIDVAAVALDCSKAFIHAIAAVESAGDGFYPNGEVKVLYERHWFRRLALQRDLDLLVQAAMQAYPELVNSVTGGYQKGLNEVARFKRAKRLHTEIAMESASYGRFQIMGFHWERLGFQSVQQMVEHLSQDEGAQLDVLVLFIQSDAKLHEAVKNEDCRAFKLIYNGPKENGYEVKLQSALDHFKSVYAQSK